MIEQEAARPLSEQKSAGENYYTVSAARTQPQRVSWELQDASLLRYANEARGDHETLLFSSPSTVGPEASPSTTALEPLIAEQVVKRAQQWAEFSRSSSDREKMDDVLVGISEDDRRRVILCGQRLAAGLPAKLSSV
jgi:hypothetical protein